MKDTLRLIGALLLAPFIIAGMFLLALADNFISIFRKSGNLTFRQRVDWYMLSRPPKTCNVCGSELVSQGYPENRRYYCRKCKKVVCAIEKL